MNYIVRLRGNGGDRVRGVGSIRIIQAHPPLTLGALRDIERQSPSKNLSALGAFMGPDVGDIDKFPLSG